MKGDRDPIDPCLSEAFIRNPNGGAVTYIGASRFGLGYPGTYEHGSSFKYDRMFYEFLFTADPPDAPQQVGAVYTRMKEHWIGSCTKYGAMRWCQFAVNLMGDPELCLYTYDPATLAPDFQSYIVAGPQTYVVETGVPGARVCLSKGNDVYTYGLADGAGHYEASINPQTSGTLFVTVTAPNYDPFEGAATVVTSAGVVALDRGTYNCLDQLGVDLADLDLAGSGTQDVLLTTDAGDSETLTLTETESGMGVFAGGLWTSADPVSVEDGVLQVAHGQIVTATYDDADDGTGSPAVSQDTAIVDCQLPGISDVRVIDVGDEFATVTFDTDEPACGAVRYGSSCGALTETAAGNCGQTSHAVQLSGLEPFTTYSFVVEAEDAGGNLWADDNGGSCYRFTTSAKLSASDAAAGDEFGYSVSVSGDVAVIGAYGADSAYVYHLDGTDWVAEATLAPSGAYDGFGCSVSLCGDAALIGAWRDEAAHVYRFDGAEWVAETTLMASDGEASDYFGYCVSLSGDVAVIGAYGDNDGRGAGIGSAYVYRFDGTDWVEEAKLTAFDGAIYDGFGRAVAVSGNVAVIGSYQDDDAGSTSGSAYVYRFDGIDWIEEAKLTASDAEAYDLFGYSVSVSGNLAVIGAFQDDDGGSNSGAVYVYRFDGTDWIEEAKLAASDAAAYDKFGWSVCVSGDVAAIGAYQDDDGGSTNSGSAYVYRFDGTDWFEDAKLTAFDGAADDKFGWSVCISDGVAVIGAHGDDVLGVASGSAYVFSIGATLPGDFDHDGDVDVDDFALFAECLNGPDSPPRCTLGLTADLDGDGDVDVGDFALFMASFTGEL